VKVTVEVTGPDKEDDPDYRRDRLIATSYLLDNVARRIGNGEKSATLVNRSFGVEATFTVQDGEG
jgi:hypothetical protein